MITVIPYSDVELDRCHAPIYRFRAIPELAKWRYLRRMRAHGELIASRDDLRMEYCQLAIKYNDRGEMVKETFGKYRMRNDRGEMVKETFGKYRMRVWLRVSIPGGHSTDIRALTIWAADSDECMRIASRCSISITNVATLIYDRI